MSTKATPPTEPSESTGPEGPTEPTEPTEPSASESPAEMARRALREARRADAANQNDRQPPTQPSQQAPTRPSPHTPVQAGPQAWTQPDPQTPPPSSRQPSQQAPTRPSPHTPVQAGPQAWTQPDPQTPPPSSKPTRPDPQTRTQADPHAPGRTEAEPESAPQPLTPADQPAPPADGSAAAGPVEPSGPRPGDVAREALRAARRGGAARAEGTDVRDEEKSPAATSRTETTSRTDTTPHAASAARSATPRSSPSAETVEELKRMARAGRRTMKEPVDHSSAPSTPAAAPPSASPRTAVPHLTSTDTAEDVRRAEDSAEGGHREHAHRPEHPTQEVPQPQLSRPEESKAQDSDPVRAASAAARSALAQAGVERRRAARDAAKPVRSGRRRRTASGPPGRGADTSAPQGAGLREAATTSGGPTAAARSPQSTEDLRRTFPAVALTPPRTRSSEGGNASEGEDASEGDKGRPRNGSWWGAAWIDALEESALDPARLVRGRDYAGRGRVDAVTVTPGLVLAYVHGSRPRPYRVKISLPTFTDEEWDRFLDAAAAQPGHIAALLDREMPQSLADCGVPLLPAPGELYPECSCPDSGHPCKHAAALCYQTARLLDEDPFVLLLLRGRGERGLLAELSRRNAALAARSGPSSTPARLPGVRARDALAARTLPPLPRPQPPLPHPEQPPTYPAAPGGPDPFALDQLATDAAARAHALLATGHDPVADLTLWQDAVRIAAARPGSGLTAASRAQYESLAAAAGRTATELARAVAAWRQGGREGLAVLEEPWDPPAGRFDQARPALRAAEFPLFTPWRNHLTHPEGTFQLRLGREGLWYAYESEPGRDDWWPRGTPDSDPVGALTALAGGVA